jgi:hypothetical protein
MLKLAEEMGIKVPFIREQLMTRIVELMIIGIAIIVANTSLNFRQEPYNYYYF